MYINTQRNTRNLFYIYVILLVVLLFEFLFVGKNLFSRVPLSLYVIVALLIFMAFQGPYIFEYDSSKTIIRIENKSYLFLFAGLFQKSVMITPDALVSFKLYPRTWRPKLSIKYFFDEGQIVEVTFYLWSLNKQQRKDIKASLSRFKPKARVKTV